MIDKKRIEELVHEKIEGTEMFLVNISVSNSNKISVLVDSMNGLPIKEYVGISRHIESSLDREVEDFELEVSSPGLDKPFQVKEQYLKNVGKDLKLKAGDKEIKGKLKQVLDDKIVLETIQKVKGKKKKESKTEEIELLLNEIKEAKVVISFK
jgi:ribosome maturation factor RimP